MLQKPAFRQLFRHAACPARTFVSPSQSFGRATERLNIRRLSQEAQDYHRNRRIFLLCGTFAGIGSFVYTAWRLKQELAKNPNKLDSGLAPTDPLSNDAAARKVVVHDEQGREVVPTGNGTVTEFPRTLELPAITPTASQTSSDLAAPVVDGVAATPTEYTLVGLGLRTVSFLGIQVYVVGFYVATADIAALQATLVKRVNPIATTLVPGERDSLRTALLDPAQSQEVWQELLQRGIPARSAFRIVPVRDTDFHHLRDGFMRAIQARSGPTNDERFGQAVRDFRALFNRGSVPKRKELLLIRDSLGRLSIMFDKVGSTNGQNPERRSLLGTIDDERISRALWLNYLGGKNVASEPARKNIVEGVMEFVERPIGTVAAQVI